MRTMERRGLSPSLSPLWQESASGKTYRCVTMATLEERRRELGTVASCGAGVRLVSKASYGTSARQRSRDPDTLAASTPGL